VRILKVNSDCKILVTLKDGTVVGKVNPVVGMPTRRGVVVKITPHTYTTQRPDGTSYRYMQGRFGIEATISPTTAKRFGFKT
jgi:hypothetical protein